MPDAPDARELLSIAIVIPNFNGERDLPGCLDSIRDLDYPRELLETIVVENGSTDASRELLERDYPWVTVLPQPGNLGFAPAVNLGVQAASSEVVALLNNDMQVDPAWLRELLSAYDPEAGYSCVAGTILDWSGERIDFVEGVLNWHGMGDQVGFGLPFDQVQVEDGKELLFACGGAMLVHRDTFLGLGGLDPEYFAYFEDIDFGWRLWLAGHRVRLAAGATCRHRHNGTSGRFPFYQRAVLYERNALRTVIKNLDEDNLQRLLGPALLMLVHRTLGEARLDRRAWDFGAEGSDDDTDRVPRSAMARLHAVGDLLDNLDELMEARRQVQLTRRVPDEELLSRFSRPFMPLGASGERYLAAAEGVRRHFRLDELFQAPRATRLAVLAYDTIGTRMAGPAVRSWEIAKALGKQYDVTVLSETPVERADPGVEVRHFSGDEELRRELLGVDAVLVHGFALERYPSLRSTPALLVVDLYDPWIFENLEMHRHTGDVAGDWSIRRDVDVQATLLDHGDFFVCASERQRDYWLGMLTARGRVDRAAYTADGTLRSLIDVLPYGCPAEAPAHHAAVLKGVHPSVSHGDFVITWGGGTWEWFDPVLALEAFAVAHAREPRLRLFFMGLDQAAGAGVPRMRVAQQLRARADELSLAGKSVIFGDWAPYDERAAYLVESDAGIIATKDLAEVRLSFRSRLLDHFWAGLPTIATSGDVLGDLVTDANAGIVVPIGDKAALADAMIQLAVDDELRRTQSANAESLAEEYRWTKSVRALEPLLENPNRWRELRNMRPGRRPVSLFEDGQQLLRHRSGIVPARSMQDRLADRIRRSRWLPAAKWVRRRGWAIRNSWWRMRGKI